MKIDWLVEVYCPCHPTYHTIGLGQYGSLELELKLPLEQKQGGPFVNLIAIGIAEHGKRYQSGDRDDDIFSVPFYLFETTPVHEHSPGERVLRILFCDPDMKYPWEDGCQAPYSEQLNEDERAAMVALLAQKEVL